MEGEFLLYSAKFEVYVFRRLVLHKHFTDHGHNAIITEKSTSLIFADHPSKLCASKILWHM